jgi:hypothetical protein
VSEDLSAEALERYERAMAFIRQGWVTRAGAERQYLGQDPRPIYFSPFRNLLAGREGSEAEKRAAGEQDRREWTEGIRRRLGLVAEVHRCRVFRGDLGWLWSCLRPGCPSAGYSCPSQEYAFAKARAHARSFMPDAPEDEAIAGMDWPAYMALAAGVPAIGKGEGW